jgi:hypothetical protein
VHVVFDRARHIAPQHLVGVQLKIGFEASASENTGVAAIGHDEHSRTRFALGRSYGTYDRREYFASPIPQQAVGDQFKARVESGPELGTGELQENTHPSRPAPRPSQAVHVARNSAASRPYPADPILQLVSFRYPRFDIAASISCSDWTTRFCPAGMTSHRVKLALRYMEIRTKGQCC